MNEVQRSHISSRNEREDRKGSNKTTICKAEFAIRQLMQMVAEGKTITISPDFCEPYTLTITDKDGNSQHTHNSYTYDEADQGANNLATVSFIDHILGEIGLSFSKGGEE